MLQNTIYRVIHTLFTYLVWQIINSDCEALLYIYSKMVHMINVVYLSLGSNSGDRLAWLRNAVAKLKQTGTITHASSVYETKAWGVEAQPDFLNLVVCLETKLNALSLLAATQQIETELGRIRTSKWGQRTLDIDLLLFNNDILYTTTLTIPHRYMTQRRFVLVPLAEIAPDTIHPSTGKTIAELLAICTDKQKVTKIEAKSYL